MNRLLTWVRSARQDAAGGPAAGRHRASAPSTPGAAASAPYQPARAAKPAGKHHAGAAPGWDDLTGLQRQRLAEASARAHPVHGPNGRHLADHLREACPEAARDMTIAHVLLTLLDDMVGYEDVCDGDLREAWALWWGAVEMAAAELTFFERMP